MFDPAREQGSPGWTGYVDAPGKLTMLGERNTAFELISRAPFAKPETGQKAHSWTVPWFSSFAGSLTTISM